MMNQKDMHGEEGGDTGIFMLEMFHKHVVPVVGKNILEVGPKHGLHTRFLDEREPGKITCVELENKRGRQRDWPGKIKTPLTFVYEELLRFNPDEKYDLILFAGVLYHNTEQLRMLKKLWSLAKEDSYMVFESATVRDRTLMGKNLIEVHWPEKYRDVSGVIFLPSKRACISMLEIAGWEVIETSDDGELFELINPQRINILCRRKSEVITTYNGIDHEPVEDE